MEKTIDGDTNPTTNFSEYPVLPGMCSERVKSFKDF
jgi:hypothetical protein